MYWSGSTDRPVMCLSIIHPAGRFVFAGTGPGNLLWARKPLSDNVARLNFYYWWKQRNVGNNPPETNNSRRHVVGCPEMVTGSGWRPFWSVSPDNINAMQDDRILCVYWNIHLIHQQHPLVLCSGRSGEDGDPSDVVGMRDQKGDCRLNALDPIHLRADSLRGIIFHVTF